MRTYKPSSPEIGSMYKDLNTDYEYIYDGENWVVLKLIKENKKL